MISSQLVKYLLVALLIATFASLAGVALWYGGGSSCREDNALAQAKHEREMSTLRDRLAAEHAAVQVELMKEGAALKSQIRALVKDKAECSYEADFISYRNRLAR